MDPTRLIDPHGLAEPFLREWDDCSDSVVAHTSGSTGTPKEIRLLKSDMVASALATCRRFGIGSSSLLYMPLSASYIAGKMMLVRAAVSGARIQVVPPSLDPLPVPPVGRVALLPIVPAQADRFLASPYASMVDAVIVGGAPISAETEQALASSSAAVYATYGMTETCSHVALRRVGDPATPFEAMPVITFAVDPRGCLVIEAPAFSFRRIVANDIVELLTPTAFRWRGRADNIINTGGIKVVPEELESKLAPLLTGISFYITSRPSERWGSELVLVVESPDDFNRAAFMEAASHILPHRLLPKQIITLPTLPRTPPGKLLRRPL